MLYYIDTGKETSVLGNEDTYGLGELVIGHPHGTFALTAASRVMLQAIASHQGLLHGTGIDWGSGVGGLAILAAKIASVSAVYGLEIFEQNIDAAVENARVNNVSHKVRFLWSDSYTPYRHEDRLKLEALKGSIDFIVSNPPSSEGDDGFTFRRIVLQGARDYLKKGGIVLLNISFQYGAERIRSLTAQMPEYTYRGIVATTEPEPFDLARQDLLDCVRQYVNEEQNGKTPYTFIGEGGDENCLISAQEAFERYEKYAVSPLSKWQTHLFEYCG